MEVFYIQPIPFLLEFPLSIVCITYLDKYFSWYTEILNSKRKRSIQNSIMNRKFTMAVSNLRMCKFHFSFSLFFVVESVWIGLKYDIVRMWKENGNNEDEGYK